ncbi:hypothetical protein AZ16_3951 [Bordetella bronchiseptica B18-5 (C3)]|nr:hypothetical protein AZ16_3951 [Bordetella bronchiseptica B18-5 (C3)]KDB67222.1 hypothetical protein AZ15_4104 [Bordetella bronchiseptica A1-7]KDB72550.1 hypothetical protein AZ21_4044 [Bordetella bronchiseptica B20-10725633]KDC42941.1 hypothetical protein L508_3903 [Bordetella bronchiseptica M435/02/3]KDC70216.1 hypothetical protein L513_3940 [Bordetella bronchiseptica MBORD632]KDC84563.1 hypothetical protein L516_3719 [Bordetella bronchiseptica MBORD668]KDC85306.1 hypothetical protein L5
MHIKRTNMVQKPFSEAYIADFRQFSVNSPSKLPNVHLFF